MTRLRWRPAELDDATGIAGLFGAIEQSRPLGLETETAEVADRMGWPALDLPADTLAGFDQAGRLRAYAEAADMGVGQGQVRVRVTCAIHPDLATDETVYALDWLLDRARRLADERHPGLPGVMGARCASADSDRMALLAAANFEVAFWQMDLVRDVSPIPAESPPGVTVLAWDPAYDEAARIAHNEAYADDPGALLPDERTWRRHATGLAAFLPQASFLALDSSGGPDQIAGFLFSLQNDREGTLLCLGTRAPWRRRGIARAMIGRAVAAFQQAGLTSARLQVEDTNAGALALYRCLGFVDSGRGYALLQAPIPSAPGGRSARA